MAEICYITYNKVVQQSKTSDNKAERYVLQPFFASGEEIFKYQEVKKELEKKNSSSKATATASLVGSIIAVRKVKDSRSELIKFIVYNDEDDITAKRIREVFYSDVISIKETITKIVKLGIGLLRTDIKDLEKIVEKAYRELEIVADAKEWGRGSWFKEIAYIYKKELEKHEKTKDGKQAYLTVNDFSDLFKETDYANKVSVYEVRAKFKDEKLTECNVGRTDYTMQIKDEKDGKGKLQKVILFNLDNLDIYCKEITQREEKQEKTEKK